MCVYNPNSNCISGILQCPAGQICDQYRCRASNCFDPGYACQGNSYCDPTTKTCIAVQGCYPACTGIQICDQNVCRMPNCFDQGYACVSPQICDSVTKQCKSQGCIETGCPYPQKCYNNACVTDSTSCRSDYDCKRSEKCDRGYCVVSSTPSVSCRYNGDCARDEICDRGSCVTDVNPTPNQGQYCNNYIRCPYYYTCINNRCQSQSNQYNPYNPYNYQQTSQQNTQQNIYSQNQPVNTRVMCTTNSCPSGEQCMNGLCQTTAVGNACSTSRECLRE